MVTGGYGPENSSGHSGSQTSQDRADREDATGITSKRDNETLVRLYLAAFVGFTCAEFEDQFQLSHGQASGSLSRLHRAGLISRKTEKRKRQQVYIHNAFVAHSEDDLAPYRPNAAYRDDRKPMALGLPNDTQIAMALERAGCDAYSQNVREQREFLEELKEVIENGG